ncbi:MAG: hypothetical protein WC341_02835 [Bacteroidales bacterium]|jgi:hypothetical protein
MEIPTLEDHKRLEEKIDLLLLEISYLRESKVAILTTDEILMKLRISYRTFQTRRPQLIKAGMVKEGGTWIMKETNLQKYLDNLTA